MSATTLINFRIESDLKNEMEGICSDLGINMTTAFVMFAKKVCREKRIPFELSIDPFYSEANRKRIFESIKQLEDGKVVVKTMEELEEMAK